VTRHLIARDAEGWHGRMAAAGSPVTEMADQPWGMREFTLTNPSGNRVRIDRARTDDDQRRLRGTRRRHERRPAIVRTDLDERT
jgi:hypothetical protein